jgi:hypothetical protein
VAGTRNLQRCCSQIWTTLPYQTSKKQVVESELRISDALVEVIGESFGHGHYGQLADGCSVRGTRTLNRYEEVLIVSSWLLYSTLKQGRVLAKAMAL